MAKKRKKGKEKEEEEYEFRPPEFDEKEFLRKELKETRTLLFTVGFAALVGIVAALLTYLSDDLVGVGFILLVGGLISLKYIYPLVKVDTSGFTKKNWAGNGAWFFFTFLAAWILMLNYPVADFADPDVSEVIVWVSHAGNTTAIEYTYVQSAGGWTWVPRYGENLADMIHADSTYTINITARVTDNSGSVTAEIAVPSSAPYVAMTYEGEHRYGFVLTGDQLDAANDLVFFIRATDSSGHETIFSFTSAIPVA